VDAKLGNQFLMTINIKHLKKILNHENIQKLFVQGKSNGFVVPKTYFSKCYVQKCGNEELNLGILPLFCAKN
jgi:hypothetical protein